MWTTSSFFQLNERHEAGSDRSLDEVNRQDLNQKHFSSHKLAKNGDAVDWPNWMNDIPSVWWASDYLHLLGRY